MKWKKTILLSVISIAVGSIANAQTAPINIVSTATPFLRISPDARSGGMGDAGIAISPDANATFWNSAKIPFATSNGQIGLTYTPWLQSIANDVYLATLGGYYKLDPDQALNFGFRYFSLGDIQLTDENGQLQGNSNPKEFSLEFGYSRKLSEKFGIGLTARYINSSLATGTQTDGTVYKAGNAFAADLSAYYNGLNDAGQGFTAGLTFSNLGTKISYTTDPNSKQFIPANMGIGGAYHIVLDQDNKLTFALDLNHLLVPKTPDDTASANSQQYADYYSTGVFDSWGKSFSNNAFQESFGAEYGYNDQFFLRAGYHAESKASGDLNYFTAGVGIKYNVFDFNFSYIAPSGNSLNRNPLSNTLRFSLIFDLGAQKNY